MTTTLDSAVKMPEGDTPEARRASLIRLSPVERLAAVRRWQVDDDQLWAPVPARPATAEEHAQLMRLPVLERLAEARRLAIA